MKISDRLPSTRELREKMAKAKDMGSTEPVLKVGKALFAGTVTSAPEGMTIGRDGKVYRTKFSKREVKKALRAGGGFISYAARKLGCDTQTLRRYLVRWPDLEKELQAVRDAHIDMAEASLLSQVQKENTAATIFMLRCLGKQRGYIENPALNLHAHVDAGAGTWADIMKRVATSCGGEVNAQKLIDVEATQVNGKK